MKIETIELIVSVSVSGVFGILQIVKASKEVEDQLKIETEIGDCFVDAPKKAGLYRFTGYIQIVNAEFGHVEYVGEFDLYDRVDLHLTSER